MVDELCFVNVPVKGQKRDLLHLVDEDLVPPDVLPQVLHFRLALASKPHDVFFLCHVPPGTWTTATTPTI